MAEEPVAELYNRGIDLFNAEKFFECHEIWEQAWKRSEGSERLFYAGMIQAAVAILHAERGNPRGARSVFVKAREKLGRLPANYMGIALGEFREDLRTFLDASLARREEAGPRPPKLRRLSGPTGL